MHVLNVFVYCEEVFKHYKSVWPLDEIIKQQKIDPSNFNYTQITQ